jgi:hypothetical protein
MSRLRQEGKKIAFDAWNDHLGLRITHAAVVFDDVRLVAPPTFIKPKNMNPLYGMPSLF